MSEINSGLLQVKIVGNEDVVLVVEATPKRVEVKINSKIIDHENLPLIIATEDVALLTILPDSEGPLKISISSRPKE